MNKRQTLGARLSRKTDVTLLKEKKRSVASTGRAIRQRSEASEFAYRSRPATA